MDGADSVASEADDVLLMVEDFGQGDCTRGVGMSKVASRSTGEGLELSERKIPTAAPSTTATFWDCALPSGWFTVSGVVEGRWVRERTDLHDPWTSHHRPRRESRATAHRGAWRSASYRVGTGAVRAVAMASAYRRLEGTLGLGSVAGFGSSGMDRAAAAGSLGRSIRANDPRRNRRREGDPALRSRPLE